MTTKTFMKSEMNYTPLSQRHGCGNCKFVENVRHCSGTKFERQGLRCVIGDFATTPQSICKKHQPASQKP